MQKYEKKILYFRSFKPIEWKSIEIHVNKLNGSPSVHHFSFNSIFFSISLQVRMNSWTHSKMNPLRFKRFEWL